MAGARAHAGLGGKVNGVLSEKVCQALAEFALVPRDRVHPKFTSIDGSAWGHDGLSFPECFTAHR